MKRSPKIVIIDSLQYLRITTAQYKELQQLFPKVLFIFIEAMLKAANQKEQLQ